MKKIKKFKINILYISVLLIFFLWGGLVSHYKIFPYNAIKFLKDNTYDKIFKPIQYFDGVTRNSSNRFNHYYSNYPNFIRKEPYISKYTKDTNIWLDRFYFNHQNYEKLSNFFIIKNKRHSKKKIRLILPNDTEIYRAVCDLNDNSHYRDWKEADFTVVIIGGSCVHIKIVKKKFNKGSVTLQPGGPISSDPIFILGNIDIDKIKVF